MNTWLLPDGINESLPDEAEKLEALRRHLIDLYATWGYRLVMPPLVEYMESLRAGMGTQLDLQTFKITDQLNGRLMGVRADITPQVARMDAHKLSKNSLDKTINRLCYMGSVLRTRSEEQGGSRSPIQVGAELFGHAGIESDFEIISLMLETLHSLDLNDLVLDLGHVGIANGVAEFVLLTNEQKESYFDMLARKSIPEIDEWVASQEFTLSESEMLLALPKLSGSSTVISKAKTILEKAGSDVLDALVHLQNMSDLVLDHFPDLELHIDLAEMRGYAYHTGIMYTVYKQGSQVDGSSSCSVAHGGRYDGVGEAFGSSRPAIGFSTDLHTLAKLSFGTTALINSLGVNGVLAPYSLDKDLDKLIYNLRSQGEQVIRQINTDTQLTPEQQGCNRIIEKQDDDWVVISAN